MPPHKRVLSLFALYMAVVLGAAAVLIRTIAVNGIAANAPVAVQPAHASLECSALATTLQDELFAWYVTALREMTEDAMRPEPLPGPLREWESARAAGEQRCASDPAAAKLAHLLNVRRALEGNRFLLSKRIGEDMAALH